MGTQTVQVPRLVASSEVRQKPSRSETDVAVFTNGVLHDGWLGNASRNISIVFAGRPVRDDTVGPSPEGRRPAAPPAAPASPPPARYVGIWYGTGRLWTMLPPAGQVWTAGSLPHDSNGIFQKMFWWSADLNLESEPTLSITVSGVRLNGGGTFGVAGGTYASADFGTAMLVGAEFPFAGCWQVTAKYRDASLTYVLWLKP